MPTSPSLRSADRVADDLDERVATHRPSLAHDVVYGARALTALEVLVTDHVVESWVHERNSLRGPLSVGPAPGLLERRAPGDDPRRVG